MAQINLLKQSKPSEFNNLGFFSVLSKLALFGIFCLLAYYGWLIYKHRATANQTSTLEAAIVSQKQELSEIKGRDEVLIRQAQVKEFDALVSGHVYWSQLMPELAKVTLKEASYLSFKAVDVGTISLAVQVPSIVELEKFLLVFNSPKINRYFTDLKVGGISRVQDEQESYVRVDVQFKYDPGLLKFKN
ncbi:MAG: hypothetical protein AAB410_04350 [Patescibacteria group bacterium]